MEMKGQAMKMRKDWRGNELSLEREKNRKWTDFYEDSDSFLFFYQKFD
jgi:hypothetical protein